MTDLAEGDINLSPAREAWLDEQIDAATRALLDEDAAAFLHQALSTLASMRSNAPTAASSPTSPDGGSWIFTATASIRSATAIRA